MDYSKLLTDHGRAQLAADGAAGAALVEAVEAAAREWQAECGESLVQILYESSARRVYAVDVYEETMTLLTRARAGVDVDATFAELHRLAKKAYDRQEETNKIIQEWERKYAR